MRAILKFFVLLAVFAAACAPKVHAPTDGGQRGRPDAGSEASRTPQQKPNADVVGVHDGDTITVVMRGTGKRERIRLATIDSPELGQPFGKAAKNSLSSLAYKRPVRIDSSGRDRYGRLLGEVFFGDLNLNVEQIRRGFAWHYKRYANEQTELQRKIYSSAEAFARQSRFGLWRSIDPVAPWEWRKGMKRGS